MGQKLYSTKRGGVSQVAEKKVAGDNSRDGEQ
jgi:hypothetical protein